MFLILFLTAIYFFMVENRLQRPSGVYVCPVFSSRTCARHVVLMVLHDCIKLQLCVMTACHAYFAIFSFFNFLKISFRPQIVLNLFLCFGQFEPHCSY